MSTPPCHQEVFASPPQGAGNSNSSSGSSGSSGDAEVYLLRPSTETVNVALFARKKTASAVPRPAAAPAAKAAATGGKKAFAAATGAGVVPPRAGAGAGAGAGVAVWEGALEAWLREVGLASDPLSLADLLPSLQPA